MKYGFFVREAPLPLLELQDPGVPEFRYRIVGSGGWDGVSGQVRGAAGDVFDRPGRGNPRHIYRIAFVKGTGEGRQTSLLRHRPGRRDRGRPLQGRRFCFQL